MPMITTVVLVDDEGDEFPIAIFGDYSNAPQTAKEIAALRAEAFIAEGTFRPKGELKVGHIEYPRT